MEEEEAAGARSGAAPRRFSDRDVDRDPGAAAQELTTALEKNPDDAECYCQRAYAHILLQKYADAVADAKKSLELNPNNAVALLRKGLGEYHMKNYASALESFREGQRLDNVDDTFTVWIKRCEETLNESQTDLNMQQQPLPPKIKYDWYQTESQVIVTIMVKNAQKDDVSVQFLEKEVNASVRLPSGESFNLKLDLLHSIVPEQSTFKVLSTKAIPKSLTVTEIAAYVTAGLPKMQVIRNYNGIPQPAAQDGPPLHIQIGDTIELLKGDAHSLFWQGRNLTTGELGFFPSDAVKPSPCVPKPVDYSSQLWFAGAMERLQAESELINRVNSTYLVRHRTKESGEYAISIKYNNEVKHIKILTRDGFFHIAENRKFKNLMELVEYYKHHSLKEGFRSLDTTLQFPYKESENSVGQRSNRTGGNVLSPKVIGIAIARYDFCARDMRELSLLKGDVVKIYTKMSANGWWRGEVNGRVGWFPSTYVEEDE